MGGQVRDEELAEYRKRIGPKKYKKEYAYFYSQASSKKSRFSKKDYENSPEKLKRIKEKYKNGVSQEIINQMLGIKEIKEK